MPAKVFSNLPFVSLIFVVATSFAPILKTWEWKFIEVNKDGNLQYIADEKGNITVITKDKPVEK